MNSGLFAGFVVGVLLSDVFCFWRIRNGFQVGLRVLMIASVVIALRLA